MLHKCIIFFIINKMPSRAGLGPRAVGLETPDISDTVLA